MDNWKHKRQQVINRLKIHLIIALVSLALMIFSMLAGKVADGGEDLQNNQDSMLQKKISKKLVAFENSAIFIV